MTWPRIVDQGCREYDPGMITKRKTVAGMALSGLIFLMTWGPDAVALVSGSLAQDASLAQGNVLSMWPTIRIAAGILSALAFAGCGIVFIAEKIADRKSRVVCSNPQMTKTFDDLLNSIDACCADSAEYAEELKGLLRSQTERVLELEDAIDDVTRVPVTPGGTLSDDLLCAILNLTMVRMGLEAKDDAP